MAGRVACCLEAGDVTRGLVGEGPECERRYLHSGGCIVIRRDLQSTEEIFFGPTGIRVGPAEDSCLAELPSHGARCLGLRRGVVGGMAQVSNGLFNKQSLAK